MPLMRCIPNGWEMRQYLLNRMGLNESVQRLGRHLGDRIANEMLMHFRAQRKSAQNVSLSDYLDSGSDGTPLELMDVVAEDCDLLEQIVNREQAGQLRQAVEHCLTPCEQQVIRLRYGLDGQTPKRQREVAEVTGLSRSYISRIEKRALQKLRKELE